MRKIIAREWLKLIIGLIFGLIIAPGLVYTFLASDEYTSTHSLGDMYGEIDLGEIDLYEDIFKPFFSCTGSERLMILAIILGPYFIYQFVCSLIWACKTSNEK